MTNVKILGQITLERDGHQVKGQACEDGTFLFSIGKVGERMYSDLSEVWSAYRQTLPAGQQATSQQQTGTKQSQHQDAHPDQD